MAKFASVVVEDDNRSNREEKVQSPGASSKLKTHSPTWRIPNFKGSARKRFQRTNAQFFTENNKLRSK